MAEEQEAPTVKNKVTIEDVGPCKKKVTVEIPEETVKSITDKEYDTLRKEALVPGFRKGRAPRRLLEKRFGKETSEQIKLKLILDASESALKDNELDTLGDPDIDHEKIELPESGPVKFDFEVEVRPQFELPELKGIAVEKTRLEVTDEQIESEIEKMRRWSGIWTPRDDEPAQLDDQIIADAIIKVEGVEEAEKLDNIEVYVRPSSFIGSVPVNNLDKLLVGAKAGQTKETTTEVPKTYFKEEYRGKKVDIKITLKDIKWLKPAELNEDFFNRLSIKDEKELQEKIRDGLQGRLEQQSRTEMAEQIYKYMLEKTDFDLPLDVVAQQSHTLLQRQYTNLLKRGFQPEQIEEKMEQIRASSELQAQEQLKIFFIMDKVAEKLEIKVSDEEVNGYIAQLAIQQGRRPERVREEMARSGTLEQFRLQVRDEKSVAKLLESAKIKEAEPKKETKKTATKEKKTTKTNKKKAKKTEKSDKNKAKKAKKTTKKKTGK